MIPTEIVATLTELKVRIQRYVLAEGTAAIVVLACLFFWITLGLDVLHFEIRKLELPVWLRTGATVLAVMAVGFIAVSWIFGRYFRGFGQRGLAMVLERRFPQLNDRLITAIDLVSHPVEARTAVTSALTHRTLLDAAQTVRSLNLSDVFDPRPLWRTVAIAGALLFSVIGFALLNHDGFQRWMNAFLFGRSGYWEPYRQSLMEVHLVAQPGDRIRKFDEHQTYKHPKGMDLTVVATSPEGKVVPERAMLSYRSFGTGGVGRGSVTMTRTDEREFRQSLSRVIDSHDLWIMGGDFVNPTPYRIEIVELPNVDRLRLDCDYPSYTGMDSLEDKPVEVVGTQVSLPMETRFILRADLNKPVTRIVFRSKPIEVELTASGSATAGRCRVILQPESGDNRRELELILSAASISEDGRQFQVPFHVTSSFSKIESELTAGGMVTHLPLPSETQLQLTLEDRDEVISPEPIPMTIAGIVDQDPVVEAKLTGVSSAVTRTASIPVAGRITDDYGVVAAEFGVKVGEGAEFTGAPLVNRPKGEKEFLIRGQQDEKVERFNVLNLQLNDGDKFSLTMFGQDGDDLNGPHRVHGEVYSFTIVSPEDLLAKLNDKELNLRLRFEQIIEETDRLREDLQKHLTKAQERTSLAGSGVTRENQEKIAQLNSEIRSCAERLLLLERKNHTECRAIQIAFQDIREEMVNNRVDSASALDRIERSILIPLQNVNDADYPGLDGHLGVFRLQEERNQDSREEMEISLQMLERLLERMKQILDVMQRRETFAELIKSLQDLRDRQAKILEETKKQQQKEAFEKLGIPGL